MLSGQSSICVLLINHFSIYFDMSVFGWKFNLVKPNRQHGFYHIDDRKRFRKVDRHINS